MKHLFVALALIVLNGCSDSSETKVIEFHPDGSPKWVKEYTGNPESGEYVMKEFFPDGTLAFEAKVSNASFVDYKRSYFENGNLMETVQLDDSADFEACCPDGFYSFYYDNGKLRETHYMKNGTFNGPVANYDSAGVKTADYAVANGMKNGVEYRYYRNGAVATIKTYRNDTLVGTAYYFTESGDSLQRHSSTNGEIDFPRKFWKEDGSSLCGEYTGDSSQVKWTWYDPAGNATKTTISGAVEGDFLTPDF